MKNLLLLEVARLKVRSQYVQIKMYDNGVQAYRTIIHLLMKRLNMKVQSNPHKVNMLSMNYCISQNFILSPRAAKHTSLSLQDKIKIIKAIKDKAGQH